MFIIARLIRSNRLIRQLNESDPQARTILAENSQQTSVRKSCSFIVPVQLNGMTLLEAKALRLTWHKLNGSRQTTQGIKGSQRSNTIALKIMGDVFEKLCNENKHVKEMFFMYAFIQGMKDKDSTKIVTLRDHSRCLTAMIDRIINSIVPKLITDSQMPTCVHVVQNSHIRLLEPFEQGQYHQFLTSYGLTPEVWERFGELLLDEIFIQESVRGYPGAVKAWVRIIAMMTDELRAGYELQRGNSVLSGLRAPVG